MPYFTHTKNPIGVFYEKDTGNYFEYSDNDCPEFTGNRAFYPHKVWVGGEGVCGMWGYRYANVKKTVAYIIVDEGPCGPILEKWDLKKNITYRVSA